MQRLRIHCTALLAWNSSYCLSFRAFNKSRTCVRSTGTRFKRQNNLITLLNLLRLIPNNEHHHLNEESRAASMMKSILNRNANFAVRITTCWWWWGWEVQWDLLWIIFLYFIKVSLTGWRSIISRQIINCSVASCTQRQHTIGGLSQIKVGGGSGLD